IEAAPETAPVREPPDVEAADAPAEPADAGAARGPDAGARVVRIQVTTDPPGAILYDGRRRLCRGTTPCAFEAPVGALLELHVERGDCVQDEPLRVTAASRAVRLRLNCPVVRPRDAGATPADGGAAPRDAGAAPRDRTGTTDVWELKDTGSR
ncbi:MAG: hypothetical protein GYA57_00335, partial [Myxococcales bacterium]|nr:hypothetical protein [Myxococcales bacterium]